MKIIYNLSSILLILIFTTEISPAQIPISSITTTSYNLAASPSITGRKGAGVKQNGTALGTRWDSVGTSFTINFNASTTADSVAINTVTTSLGIGSLLTLNAIAKIRRVANADVPNTGEHYPFWAAVNAGFPAAAATTGTFDVAAPEITSLESALISNNINSGYDNVFQNTSANVHYGNIERVDYIIPNGFTPSAGADLTKIGFTIYDRGVGDPFKIAGIKAINASNDPSDYNVITASPFAACLGVVVSNFTTTAGLLGANFNYVIFQRDPRFNNSEFRPSTTGAQNIKGVFISLAALGFTASQKVYGFSLFADDILTTATVASLLNYSAFPTNTANANILDLVNGLGVGNFGQTVLASSLQLNAQLQNKVVALSFANIGNYNQEKFVLQRAGVNNMYEDIADIINGQKTFVDVHPLSAVSFYRIKIIKQDGSISYSNIQVIANNEKITNIFPTLATDILYIQSSKILLGAPVNISIYSADGKLISNVIETANNLMSYNVTYLARGKYWIIVKQDGKEIAKQLFIKG